MTNDELGTQMLRSSETPIEIEVEGLVIVDNKTNPRITAEELTNQLANTFPFSLAEKQNLLVETNIVERLKFILKTLNDVKGIDEVENDINKRVRDKTEKQQKEYFLREKLKATQEELDELTGNSSESEEQQILKKIESGMYPENVAKKIKIELNRYLQMPSASMESGMLKTYIDTLVNLPWKEKTEDNDSLDNIQKVLDEDHYGLDEVKERISKLNKGRHRVYDNDEHTKWHME